MHESSPGSSLDRFEAMLDSLQDSLFLLEDDGTISYANERLAEATGMAVEELVGRNLTDLQTFVQGDSLDAFQENVDAVASGSATERRISLPVTSPTEGERVVEARITGTETTDPEGVVVVLRDITERVETEETLSTKAEQLTVLNSVLRHDIRNDMNIVLGWADQLEQHVASEKGRDILGRISRHGSHVVELTYATRDLMQAIEHGWELDLRPVRIDEMVIRETELVGEQFPNADIVLPETVPEVAVEANELLGSVIANLLTNAIRHNDSDTPHVDVEVDAAEDMVTLTIADNGPGIPCVIADAIYEHGVKGPDSPGTGLGLYLVKSLVDAFDGTIEISDNEPRGTVVTVDLHRAQ